jgi:fibronectin type 3 domain-containing protein
MEKKHGVTVTKFVRQCAVVGVLFLCIGCDNNNVEIANISNIQVKSEGTSIHVSWEPSDNANCYYVYRLEGSGPQYYYWGVTDKNKFTDSAVNEAVEYSYRIYPAIKKVDKYERGNVFMTSDKALVKTMPKIHYIYTSLEDRCISWEEIDNTSTYSVYRKKDNDATYDHLADVKDSYYYDTTYNQSSQYYYMIETRNDRQEESDDLNFGNPVLAFNIPIINQAIREDKFTSVISWDAVGEGANYSVYRAQSESGEYELIGKTDQPFFRDLDACIQKCDEEIDAFYYKVKVDIWDENDINMTDLSLAKKTEQPESLTMLFVAQYEGFLIDGQKEGLDGKAIFESEFEADLKYLKNNQYVTITLKQLHDYIAFNIPLPENAVMLTIDHAKHGVYKYAYPLLKKYKMQAILSVGEEYIQDESINIQEREYCNWNEINEMAWSNCIELVPTLYSLEDTSGKRESIEKLRCETTQQYSEKLGKGLVSINCRIKNIMGYEPKVFAYPDGNRNVETDRILFKAFGYSLLLGDNNARRSRINYFIDQSEPLNMDPVLLNRRRRETGTSLEAYIIAAERFDALR